MAEQDRHKPVIPASPGRGLWQEEVSLKYVAIFDSEVLSEEEKHHLRGWIDGWAVARADCSSRGPGVGPQHPRAVHSVCSSISGDPTPPGLWALYTQCT